MVLIRSRQEIQQNLPDPRDLPQTGDGLSVPRICQREVQ
jgi:hypothetical protein